MAGVTDTQQHSGHQQHPGPQLTGRGGLGFGWNIGCVCVCVCVCAHCEGLGWWAGELNMHSQICI